MVESLAVPKPENSPLAVVVSGGKQYRVALGDRILVDRLAAEPGSSIKLGRVLLVLILNAAVGLYPLPLLAGAHL